MQRLITGLLILGFLQIVVLPAMAQKPPLEGSDQVSVLSKKLEGHSKEDTAKVQLLTDIAYEYNKISPYDGIRYANQAIALSEKLHWKLGEARGNSCLGANYFSLSNFPKAYQYWIISLRINEEIGNEVGVANHYHNIGNVFFSQKNYTTALEYYEKALQRSKAIGNDKILTHSYSAIGDVYAQLKKYDKALSYYYNALDLDKKAGLKGNIAADNISIGNIYNEQGNYSDALKVLMFGKQVKKEIGDKKGMANAYKLMGKVMLNLAADTAGKVNSDNKKGSIDSAVVYLDSAVALDKEMGYLDNMQQSYRLLSEAQTQLDDYKSAFKSFTLYTQIKDSVFSIEKQAEIFNLQKKEELEDQKRREEKELEAKERRENIQMAGISVFIIVLIGVLLVLRRRKVSPQIINVLCTLSVLIFFEFINLLIHGRIEALTHHNLVLTLLCLLLIAAIIIPVHHKLEHWLKKKIVH